MLRELRNMVRSMIDLPERDNFEPTILTVAGGYPAPEGARDPNEEPPKPEPDKTPNQWRKPPVAGGR